MGGYPSILVGSVSVCHFKINEQTYSRPRLRESTYHPGHFSIITKHQLNCVVANWKREGPEAAAILVKKGSGPKKRILDEVRATVKDLAVSPVKCSATERHHFSQREIAGHLNISKISVFEILKEMN